MEEKKEEPSISVANYVLVSSSGSFFEIVPEFRHFSGFPSRNLFGPVQVRSDESDKK